MNTELKVTHRNEYGIDRYYPACRRSQIFADIAGKKTLNSQTMTYIKELGYTVVQERVEL
jgi:hypothetical protein